MTKRPFLDIGKRLRWIRHDQSKLNRTEWADVHALLPTRYGNWENGIRRIGIDEAIKLCDRYGVSLDFIYYGRLGQLPKDMRDRYLTRGPDT